jgi:Fe-S cluster biogenesis protein NfuA
LINDQDLKAKVARVLAEEVSAALAMDATAIELVGVEGGVAQIRLTGGCGTCPSSIMAVVTGIEQELTRRIPAIQYVEIIP